MKARAEVNSMTGISAISKVADFIELTKPRIAGMVLVVAFAGFYMASPGALDWLGALHALVGTAFIGCGSSAFNQVYEHDFDALMERTRNRPLPAGRLNRTEAIVFSLIISIFGVVYLVAMTTLLAGGIALATLVLYVFIYTPLKRVTTFNTAVGAVPGALPPLIGWAAATGSLTPAAWAMFAILYLWQIPHFLAIAWMYRDDYARGGFKMLPVVDPSGESNFRQMLSQGAALIPFSLLPTILGLTGVAYFFTALVLGLAFMAFGFRASRTRTRVDSRRLVLASVVYLPVLLAVMMLDKV